MPQSDNNKEQTAAERILVLEDKLSQSNHRVAQLKRRVAGLERDVERLGGTVQPWVLDPLKSNARNTES
jgi:CII-binding regulator of phage lambda lysogenization HflD